MSFRSLKPRRDKTRRRFYERALRSLSAASFGIASDESRGFRCFSSRARAIDEY